MFLFRLPLWITVFCRSCECSNTSLIINHNVLELTVYNKITMLSKLIIANDTLNRELFLFFRIKVSDCLIDIRHFLWQNLIFTERRTFFIFCFRYQFRIYTCYLRSRLHQPAISFSICFYYFVIILRIRLRSVNLEMVSDIVYIITCHPLRLRIYCAWREIMHNKIYTIYVLFNS